MLNYLIKVTLNGIYFFNAHLIQTWNDNYFVFFENSINFIQFFGEYAWKHKFILNGVEKYFSKSNH